MAVAQGFVYALINKEGKQLPDQYEREGEESQTSFECSTTNDKFTF